MEGERKKERQKERKTERKKERKKDRKKERKKERQKERKKERKKERQKERKKERKKNVAKICFDGLKTLLPAFSNMDASAEGLLSADCMKPRRQSIQEKKIASLKKIRMYVIDK